MADLKTGFILSKNLLLSSEGGLYTKTIRLLLWFSGLNSQMTTSSDGFKSLRLHENTSFDIQRATPPPVLKKIFSVASIHRVTRVNELAVVDSGVEPGLSYSNDGKVSHTNSVI